ncbi:MAG: GNAT family N-acetyltransferase [Ferruginibacter sp.]
MDTILETDRLFLRRFTLNDSKLLLDLNSDPEVLKYIHELPLKSAEEATAILQDIILPQYLRNLGRWAVHLKQTQEFIGWCGLKYLEENEEIDLGYRFFKKYWGNGYATESASASLNLAQTKLNLSTIVGKAHLENIASQKVLEKIGMQYDKSDIIDNCPVKVYRSVAFLASVVK